MSGVEQLLADQEQAEIFRVKRADAGFEVWFGLEKRQGVEAGARVDICSENGGRYATRWCGA
jgi:hypothetical protein